MRSFNSILARTRRVPNNSDLRYVSRYASPTSPRPPYRTQVMHLVAAYGHWTWCHRTLSDPYTVFVDSGHRLCDQCARIRNNQ